MITSLNRIRAKPIAPIPTRQKWMGAAFALLLGAALGLLAKYLDGVPSLGEVGTMLGVWVLVATLLAAWSRSPEAAALHVFLFFAAMLLAYYWYSMVLFGFFPRYYFLSWGGIALLSPLAAYIAWYARGSGWAAAVCAALPVALLLAEGYHFFAAGSLPHGFDLLAAALLVLVLGGTFRQRARILAIALVVFVVFRQVHVINLIFSDR